MCQELTSEEIPSTENGRKRVREAASIEDNSGRHILRLIGNEDSFVYHMTNQCYRKYTFHKFLDEILSKSSVTQSDENCKKVKQ